MENIIKLIDEQKELEQTEDLILDDIEIKEFTKEVKEKIESISDLAFFTLNNCELTSLKNFPQNKSIVKLELAFNSFPASDLSNLSGLKEL